MRKSSLTILLSVLTCFSFAQKTINIGGWRMHLPYNSVEHLVESPNLVFVRAEIGLYSFNKVSGEIETYTTVKGFAESQVSAIAYSEDYNTLVIGYRNTNIDLLKDGKIINLPGILRKSIVGAKEINEIRIFGKFAYVCTSFGVVVIDLDVEDIADSYLNIGPAGSGISILSAAEYDGNLFLGTADGVMTAPLQGKNLSDFNSWSFIFPDTIQSHMLRVYDGILYFIAGDERWIYNGSTFNNIDNGIKYGYRSMEINQNKLVICRDSGILVLDQSGIYRNLSERYKYAAILDHQDNIWTGGFYSGLIKISPSGQQSYIKPQGPFGPTSYRMADIGNQIYVTSGGHSSNYSPLFTNFGYYVFEEGTWTNRDLSNPSLSGMYDFTVVETNENTGDVWLGTFGTGLLHLRNGQFVEKYNASNSPLDQYVNGWIMILGLALEDNGDLWVSNFEANRTLAVRRADGSWETFNVNNQRLGEIVIDDFGTKWILVERGASPTAERGIVAFRQEDDGTVRTRRLVKGEGLGNLPHSTVNAAVLDKDGEIWIGTDAGIAVFYNPSLVFDGGVNADAQQIVIDDGQDIGYLLGNEVVNDIKVDGANRKWAATNNGVWLISADGSEVILHFTTENSPLPSNQVYCIAINGISGEVFFGTEAGIISFRSDATEASDFHSNTLVYPNPVHEGYEGPITITGLPEDATVKIADVAGRVVYELIATGGTAVWDGRNFAGELPKSGVYLIFTANKDDEDVLVTKLLIVR